MAVAVLSYFTYVDTGREGPVASPYDRSSLAAVKCLWQEPSVSPSYASQTATCSPDPWLADAPADPWTFDAWNGTTAKSTQAVAPHANEYTVNFVHVGAMYVFSLYRQCTVVTRLYRRTNT